MKGILHTTTEDPVELFQEWLRAAEAVEVNDANAAALATATREGQPSVRMVLIKHSDADGFRFFTNMHSQKGREIGENPRGALCFHWKSLRRQVRVEGAIALLDDELSEAYFHSRSRRSQIAAAVSRQSESLESRLALEREVEEFSARYDGVEVPRPAHWKGFILKPQTIEFWADGEDRLHHRLLFTRNLQGWQTSLLYP